MLHNISSAKLNNMNQLQTAHVKKKISFTFIWKTAVCLQ